MLLRAVMGSGSGQRSNPFYAEGVPPLTSQPWAYGGDRITQDEAVRIVAIQACVAFLADTIATLPTGAYTRTPDARVPAPSPGWLSSPLPDDPSVTWIDHLTQLVWSLALDGNSFTLALPDVYDAAELYVVNPQRTRVTKRGEYEIDLDGGGREKVGPDQMIHIARNRRPGQLRGFSPVEEGGTTFAMKRAADRFAKNVFSQGIFLSGQLLIPGPADKGLIELLRLEIEKQYQGPANAGKPGIFAGGAKWDIPTPNFTDMQLIELHKFAKLEAAGLFRIPPYLIGVTDDAVMARASVEAQGVDLEKYSIRPYIERIEEGYRRLLPPGEFLRINPDGLMRADFKSRWEGYQIGLQSKVLYIEDVWRWENLDPKRGGTLLETPNNNAPPEPVQTRDLVGEERERRYADVLSLVATRAEPAHVEVNTGPVNVHPAPIDVDVTTPDVHVTTPAIEVRSEPVIHVEPTPIEFRAEPVIHVDPAPVQVNVPQQAAATVNVTTPDTIRIEAMPPRVTRREVVRNQRGAITETTEVETDG